MSVEECVEVFDVWKSCAVCVSLGIPLMAAVY